MDTLQQLFGTVVRRRRETAGLSQEGLADEAGLHRTYISLLERGRRLPSIGVVQKLAQALNTTMASLMEELEQAVLTNQAGPSTRPSPKRPPKTRR